MNYLCKNCGTVIAPKKTDTKCDICGEKFSIFIWA